MSSEREMVSRWHSLLLPCWIFLRWRFQRKSVTIMTLSLSIYYAICIFVSINLCDCIRRETETQKLNNIVSQSPVKKYCAWCLEPLYESRRLQLYCTNVQQRNAYILSRNILNIVSWSMNWEGDKLENRILCEWILEVVQNYMGNVACSVYGPEGMNSINMQPKKKNWESKDSRMNSRVIALGIRRKCWWETGFPFTIQKI